MRPPLVIYHAFCMDGAGAALAAWTRLGDDAEYRPAQHGDPAPSNEDVADRAVYILDFSWPRAELQRMHDACGGPFLVLDHHKTAQADLAGLGFAHFDMDHSGAVLAWQHFRGDEPVPDLLLYIEDRDLWRWALPSSKEVSAALYARGGSIDFRNLIPLLLLYTLVSDLVSEGKAILRMQARQIEAITAHAELVALDGIEMLVANAPVLQSEVGEALALACPPVGGVWFRDGKRGGYVVSLRSRNGYDVTLIAKRHGGGGHAAAAGFKCAELPWAVRP